MLLAVNGTAVTLIINNKSTATYTFGPRVIDGKNYGLNKGMTGMGSNNSRGQYDNVAVQVLPPQVTYDTGTVNLATSTGDLVLPPATGSWTQSTAGYSTAPATGWAIDLAQLGGVGRLSITSWVDVTAALSTTGVAGLVFDYYAANDFKFALIDVANQRAILGHVDPRRGWTLDSVLSLALASSSYTLDLQIKGASSSLTVNGGYGISLGWNAGVSGGLVGIIAVNPATFATLRVRTDDPAFLPANSPLTATAVGPGTSGVRLTPGVTSWALTAAEDYWIARGADPARFAGVLVRVAQLGGAALGSTTDTIVTLAADAAGWGWSLGTASGRIDLVTVIAHELGHLLGLGHAASGLMAADLGPGTSWVPAPGAVDRTQVLPRAATAAAAGAGAGDPPGSVALPAGTPLVGLPLVSPVLGTGAGSSTVFVALAQLLAGLGWADRDAGPAPWYPWAALASGPVCDGLGSLVA